MNRYIGESRNREEPTKELFKEYFYQVVLYKERKPGIYLEIDDHMRRIFVLEFFKRIIREYIEKKKVNPLQKIAEFLHRYSPI